jgi:hypothetical protein
MCRSDILNVKVITSRQIKDEKGALYIFYLPLKFFSLK